MYVNQHSTAGQGCTEKHNHDKKRGSLANQSYSHHRLLAGLQLQREHSGRKEKEMTKEMDK